MRPCSSVKHLRVPVREHGCPELHQNIIAVEPTAVDVNTVHAAFRGFAGEAWSVKSRVFLLDAMVVPITSKVLSHWHGRGPLWYHCLQGVCR